MIMFYTKSGRVQNCVPHIMLNDKPSSKFFLEMNHVKL